MKRTIYIISLLFLPWVVLAQSSDQNYVLTRVYQTSDGIGFLDQIQYFDGLGRPVQTVKKGQSLKNGTTWVDLVSRTEYDGMGREYKHWLPVLTNGSTGAFVIHDDFVSLANTQYTSNEKPFALTEFEPSPLNRITGQYGAGAAWQNTTAPKKVSTVYQTNDGTVTNYFVNSNNLLEKGENYAASTLYKTVVTDEDGRTSTEYKNILGQVIMKQSSTDVKTYYVYNNMGQLCYVIPPIAADNLTVQTTYSDDNANLKQYCYLYKYDARGNCIEKKLPGCEPIYMAYDRADRLILSQDGNQRAKTPTKQWTVTKYDMLGRVVYTGILKSNDSRDTLQALIGTQLIVESFDVNNTSFYNTGYTCTGSLTGIVPVSVNYYDSYEFRQKQTAIDISKLSYVALSGYDAQFDEGKVKGLLTGSRTYMLEQPGVYLASAFYYDDHGRIVQSRSSNQLGGYDIVYYHYHFTGKVLNTLKEHNIANRTMVPEVYGYTYNQAGQLANTTYQYNNGTAITLSANAYDELGRLKTKSRHNATDTENYSYNIRNWTTRIMSGTFDENIYYNANPAGITPCFNGNISMSTWTYNGVLKKYGYDYDGLNRLQSGTFYDNNNISGGSNYEHFEYDKQGNIQTLFRMNAASVPIDNLVMTYEGNQVKSVTDQYGSQNLYATKEYNNKANTTTEMTYDPNGNLIKDLDRDIVTIRYNLLNLPDTIQFKNGNRITNMYASDGRKLRTEYATLTTALDAPITEGIVFDLSYGTFQKTGTVYIDNFEYKLSGNWDMNTLQRVHNPEGYYGVSSTGYSYNRKDHLGNIREVWQASNKRTIQRTQYYPSGLPWAEGLVPGEQPYKYNGKEFIEMSGYDTYDYGARGYYPAMGRFSMSVDPMAELKPWQSPYMYCSGNPVNRTDPTGMIDEQPIRTIGLSELTVTATNNNSSSSFSPSAQFVNNASTNTVQTPRITPPTPTFNLPTNANANNVANGNQTKLEGEEALKKVEAMIKLLGITEGGVKVVEKVVNGVPTIAIVFKDGAALANLAAVLSKYKGAIGPVGFGLNEFSDILKLTSGRINGSDFLTKLVINGISVAVPEVGVVWFCLEAVSAQNYPKNLPYYQNDVCPLDNTIVIKSNLKH